MKITYQLLSGILWGISLSAWAMAFYWQFGPHSGGAVTIGVFSFLIGIIIMVCVECND